MREINTPYELTQLKLECIERVNSWVDLVRSKLKILMPYPKVIFGLEGTTAGRAYWPDYKISFQPVLLRHNVEDFLKQTAGHEVAHLAAHCKHGAYIDPHGNEWRNVMWGLGLPANRCHNYDTGVIRGKANKRIKIRAAEIQEGTMTPFDMGKVVELE